MTEHPSSFKSLPGDTHTHAPPPPFDNQEGSLQTLENLAHFADFEAEFPIEVFHPPLKLVEDVHASESGLPARKEPREGGGVPDPNEIVLSLEVADKPCRLGLMEEAPNDGTLVENEMLQRTLVDSVRTDLGRVSIAHAPGSGNAGGRCEGGSAGGSLQNGAEVTTLVKDSALESGSSDIVQPPSIDLDAVKMDSHKGGVEENVEETMMQKSERNFMSPQSSSIKKDGEQNRDDEGASDSTSSDEDEDEVEEEDEDSSDEGDSSEEDSSDEEDEEPQKDGQKMEEELVDFEEGKLKESPVRGKLKIAEDVVSDEDEGPKEPIRSKNETKEQPSVPRVSVTLEPHHKTIPVGFISSVVGLYLVVEGIEGQQALNEGSILWLTEHRLPLGIVDELFGPVKKPFYAVRYNEASEVPEEAKEGAQVSYVMEFADFVLNNPDLFKKGYDASGENDEELVEAEIDFSDDEREAEYKRSKARTKRGNLEISIQENEKWSEGSWDSDKRRQGEQPRKVNNRRQRKGSGQKNWGKGQSGQQLISEEGRVNSPGLSQCSQGEQPRELNNRRQMTEGNGNFSRYEHGFSHRPPRNQGSQFHYQDSQKSSRSEGVKTVQLMSASVQSSEHLPPYQAPNYQHGPLQHFSSPTSQPHLPGQATLGMPLISQPQTALPASVQCSEHIPAYQSPNYHQRPLQQFSSPSQPHLLGQATLGMPFTNQPQTSMQQFPSSSQPQLSGQGAHVASSFGTPLRNHLPLLSVATTNSVYAGMQTSAVPGPVLGIPAGPVGSSFNYPQQLPYNHSFSSSIPIQPAVNAYGGNIIAQGVPPMWGSPEHLRRTQPPLETPAFSLQQQPSQQTPPHYFNQRMGPPQGPRYR